MWITSCVCVWICLRPKLFEFKIVLLCLCIPCHAIAGRVNNAIFRRARKHNRIHLHLMNAAAVWVCMRNILFLFFLFWFVISALLIWRRKKPPDWIDIENGDNDNSNNDNNDDDDDVDVGCENLVRLSMWNAWKNSINKHGIKLRTNQSHCCFKINRMQFRTNNCRLFSSDGRNGSDTVATIRSQHKLVGIAYAVTMSFLIFRLPPNQVRGHTCDSLYSSICVR